MDPFANGLHCVYDHRKHSFVPFDQHLSYTDIPLSSPTTSQDQRTDPYETNFWADPLTSPVDVTFTPNTEDTVDNEVIPVHGHIRRPRNAFMIFRAEFQANNKIDRAIEHDNRHISRIIGHCWGHLTDEEKDVWRRRADQEKLAHMRKYPDYKFAPILRKEKPVKRKTKRNNEEEMIRCRRVADLLLEGKQGDELVKAVNKADGCKTGDIPLEQKVSKLRIQPDSSIVSSLEGSSYLNPFDVFASPLLPPDVMATRSMGRPSKPVTNPSAPQPPIQSSYPTRMGFEKYDHITALSPTFTSSYQAMPTSPPEDISFRYEPISPMAYDMAPYYPDYNTYCASYPDGDVSAPMTYSSYRQSPYHSHSPNFAVPAVQMHLSADAHYLHFQGLDSTQPSPAAIPSANTLSPQRRSARPVPRSLPFHPCTGYQMQAPTTPSSNPMISLDTDSIHLQLPDYNVRG